MIDRCKLAISRMVDGDEIREAVVRTILREMREPTEEMIKAGGNMVMGMDDAPEEVAIIWRDMIDAALK